MRKKEVVLIVPFPQNNGGNKMSYSKLNAYFRGCGYSFKVSQIASFYTALKTKGFVILAGLSGTGKTKMAQIFSEMLGPKFLFAANIGGNENKDKSYLLSTEGPSIFIWEKTGIEPKELKGEIDKPCNYPTFLLYFDANNNVLKYILRLKRGWYLEESNKKKKLEELKEELKKYGVYSNEKDEYRLLEKDNVNGDKLIERLNKAHAIFVVDKITKIEKKYKRKRDIVSLDRESSWRNLLVIKRESVKNLCNVMEFPCHLFLSVRPDWKDSKQLLGFYNPLTHSYEPTPLFDFILNAIENYKTHQKEAAPYFLILDEMNLAHVEYYFSDFLSVLESGRNKDGFTREGIKVKVGEENEKNEKNYKKLKALGVEIDGNGYLKLQLPPNFYIIGTVNIDETTSMFSPKVLDRAFTIEFTDVDIDEYKKTLEGNSENSRCNIEDIEKLREDFTNDGEFLKYGNKARIKKVYENLKDKDIIDRLKDLNALLKPFNLHFGYRVVDEIMLFFDAAKKAEGNKIVKFENGDYEILDLAVMMKVLPKFHGNAAKLRKPLLRVLCWAKGGSKCTILNESTSEGKTDNEEKKIMKYISKNNDFNLTPENILKLKDGVEKALDNGKQNSGFTYPHTARKVLSMLYNLLTEGYTGFMQ